MLSRLGEKTKLKSGEIYAVITFHPSVRHLSFLIFFSFFSHFSHLTLQIIFWRPLFAYSSYNFYGAAICIKAVYSRDPHCKEFVSKNFKFESVIAFDLIVQSG